MIVTLINYFPDINHLELTRGECRAGPSSFSAANRELHISAFRELGLGLLDCLSELAVFDEIVVNEWFEICAHSAALSALRGTRRASKDSNSRPLGGFEGCTYITREYCGTR